MTETEPTPEQPEKPEPGPTDVTMEELLDATTNQLADANRQLTIASIKMSKQAALIENLQKELVEKSKKR